MVKQITKTKKGVKSSYKTKKVQRGKGLKEDGYVEN